MHAVILAGGKGIRLRPYTTRLPKPLVPIGEEHSIMEIVLSQLAWSGFSRVTLAIGHLGELIRSYVGDGSRWGVQVDYGMPEEMPLGTMGPVLRVLDRLPENFLVMNGDVLTDLDYADLMLRHAESGSPLTVATFQRQERIDRASTRRSPFDSPDILQDSRHGEDLFAKRPRRPRRAQRRQARMRLLISSLAVLALVAIVIFLAIQMFNHM